MSVTRVRQPEILVGGRRLGRNFLYDSRSAAYLVPVTSPPQSRAWERHIPILDQGHVGSCTGNAETGALGTTPFWETMQPGRTPLDEAFAVNLYSLATQVDDYPGAYVAPAWDDTGSDGTSVCKAAQQLGFISGYLHATSSAAMAAALQSGPVIVGSDWTSSMDTPGPDGIISDPVAGTVRGGHEYLCREVDVERQLFWFDNSWGSSFGIGGRFAYSWSALDLLLARGGDVTASVPITVAPPVPQPDPLAAADAGLAAAFDKWEGSVTARMGKAGQLRHAGDLWKAAHGYL